MQETVTHLLYFLLYAQEEIASSDKMNSEKVLLGVFIIK